jgi:hypothetical protein
MNGLWNKTMRRVSGAGQQGQAILLLAFMMVALTGMLGLAIDGGGLFFLHRDTQNAVDAALIASLYAKCTAGVNDPDPEPRIRFAALEAAKANGFVDVSEGGNAQVSVNTHYQPDGTSGEQYIRVSIVATKPSYFIQLVYREALTVTTSGVGYCEPSRLGLLPGDSAIISFRNTQSGCNLGQQLAISNTGTSYMRVHDSGVFSNSPHPTCALNARGTSDFIVDGPCQTVGGFNPSEMSCGLVSPNQQALTNMNPLHDLDRPVCVPGENYIRDGSNKIIGANPGTYDQWDIKGTFNLNPGVYCVEDIRMNSQGRLSGDGVILYMPPGNDGITMNGGAMGNLKAPTLDNCIEGVTCDWAGLLIWSDVSNPNGGVVENDPIHLNGGSGHVWFGMVYAPGSECTMEGNQKAEFFGIYACYSVRGAGTQDLDIYYEFPEFLKVPPRVSITS